jgi:PAS domain S-box-containing protein
MASEIRLTDSSAASKQSPWEGDALLRSVGDNLPGAIFEVAITPAGDRHFRYISDGIERLLGLAPSEVLADANCLYRLIVEDDLPRLIAEENRAYLERAPFDCVFRQRTLDGEVRWMHCRSAPRATADGTLVWDGVVLDITPWKHAEQAQQRYRLLAEHTRDIVLFIRADGSICEANGAALSAYGYGYEELVALNIADLRDPATAHLVPRQLSEANEHGIMFETVHRRKDGTLFPVEVNSRGAAVGKERLLFSVIRDITDRRRAEQEIRESEARYRALIDSISDVFWRWNPANNEHDAAAARWWRQLTGKPISGQTDAGWIECVHPDDRREAKAAWEHSLVTGAPYDAEYRILSHDNQYRMIRARGTPVLSTDGKPREWVGLLSDVTQQRHDEHATQALAAIVESSDDAIISKDLRGNITSWNAAATKLYGFLPEEIIGQSMGRLIPPELQEEEPLILARLCRGETISHYETVRIAKDGRRIDVSLTVSPVRDRHGKVVGVSKIARDITEKKRSEAAVRFLSEASALLASSLDYESTLTAVAELSVPTLADWCAIDIWSPEGTLKRVAVAHVNPAKQALARELHRRYPSDSETSPLLRIIRTGNSERVAEITDEMLAASGQDPQYIQVVRDLGLKSYLGVPLKIRGRTLGAILFVAAESGRQFTKNDLTLAEDLAHRAAVSMENALLYAEVRETSRRKDEFLATLAHELRNPLAPIRNAMALFRITESVPAELQEARGIVDRQLDQLARLVDDLLDVSRFTRGKIELRRERIVLSRVIENALEMSRPLITASRHELVVEQSPQPLVLEADATRLSQVVGNLLNNSAKYTDAGGTIWLSTRRVGNDAVIQVRDNGIGIPKHMLRRVFDLFTQVDSSIERRQGGLGIGLTLVQRLVAMHDGSIEAASDGEGKGSTFTVRLPLALPCDNEVDDSMSDLPANPKVSASRRILIADDNKDSADTLAMLLRLLGNDVKAVYSGTQALEEADSYRPQMLVLDIGMPGMSGYEVARQLRSQPAFENVFLVALTGWGQEEDRRRTREAGFNHHLVKPVDLKALQDLLADIAPPAAK